MAPASNASWVDSTCSATEIGTAGLSRLVGSEPVIATVMMQGVSISFPRPPVAPPRGPVLAAVR